MSASIRRPAPDRDAARTAELGARLRALRQARGLTLDTLAESAGLDKGYLSRLERGLKNPSIATVLRLSEALEVPVAELFGERLAEHAVRVTRAPDRLAVSAVQDGAHGIEALSRDGAALEAFVLHPAAEFSPDGHAEHAGEELFFVLRGTVELRFADRGFVLEAGDCAQFPGHLPHRIRRVGPEPASALVAVARPAQGRKGQR
ncbi:helix-turn-helix domain-containing protein [Pararoseomonas indoligenes]|uniref:Helix-turn-helix transcriptional regulator n=1 Tax=Roseomonas indoligenes TaxID=2820811 RepID=A0A940MY06_9PROT|nr:XRE family transcriptional regulator [Pararoseomonas indoligenes]MBP0495469.1 helix-turn-helix transcriptional regulator [Pararoseomonas indoligenes]